ncbi:hypothetical protein Bca52824_052680 [Brassica carinata]|uniref:Uncharacterized protein n=1 Tax=Brassica carinata TaxID=52824 RepID=A0A8X7UIZ4_BRACI|nr:hypothetical protein Bca52824_052680 [Brassica carinata]
MDSHGSSEKSLKVNIPVPAPINNKPEKEEDGFTTPKGLQSRNPPQPKTPPAPSKGKPPLPERGGIRQKTIQDLNTSFSKTHI